MSTSASRRLLSRAFVGVVAALMPAACLIPEYRVAGTGGSGGTNSSGGTSSSGGKPGTGSATNSGGQATTTGGAAATGGRSGSGGTSGDGGGGGELAWDCAGETPPDGGYIISDGAELCGFAWTGMFNEAEITPSCGSGEDCFSGFEAACATAILPANDVDLALFPGVFVGFNVAQPSDGGAFRPWALTGEGLTVNFSSAGSTGPTRLDIGAADGVHYCASVGPGVPLRWDEFTVECWPGGAHSPTLPAGEDIEQIIVQVLGGDTPQVVSEFCLNGVTLHDVVPPIECDGCAQLFAPLAEDKGTSFRLDLNPGSPAAVDLSNSSVTARLFVKSAGNSGGVWLRLVSEGGTSDRDYWADSDWTSVDAAGGMIEISLDAADAATTGLLFDPTRVTSLNVVVHGGADGVVYGETTVYLDALTFSNPPTGLPDFTFDQDLEGMVVDDNFTDYASGSMLSWLPAP